MTGSCATHGERSAESTDTAAAAAHDTGKTSEEERPGGASPHPPPVPYLCQAVRGVHGGV